MRIAILVPGFPCNGGTKRLVMLGRLMAERGHDVTFVSHRDDTPQNPNWVDLRLPVVPEVTDIDADAWVVYECAPRDLVLNIADYRGRKFLIVLSARYQKGDLIEANIRTPQYIKMCTTQWLYDECVRLGEKARTDSTLLLTGMDPDDWFPERIPHSGINVGIYRRYEPYVSFYEARTAFELASSRCPGMTMVPLEHGHLVPAEMRRIYGQCDIWLNAHKMDGLGMPSLEAMACGCCLVTTDTMGNRFYARHNETALVSPPSNAIELAKNLVTAVRDKALRERLAEAGQRFAQSLSWETSADKFESILLKHTPPPPARKPYVSVLCTTYQGLDLIRDWLNHIGPCLPPRSEVIVSDNGSTDGSVEFLKKYKTRFDLKCVFNHWDRQMGFAANARSAQDAASGKWVVMTQNDCMFRPGSIQALIDTFQRVEEKVGREIGCIGIAGGFYVKEFRHFLDFSNWNGDGLVGYGQKVLFDYVEVDWLNGFLLVYRGDVAREKGIAFDPGYNPSYDDIDICYQFNRRNGLPTIMVSMDANKIPLIHHIRNQTIYRVHTDYKERALEARKRFFSIWYPNEKDIVDRAP